MLTIAYIGNGKSTNRYHLPFVLTRQDFRVKAVFSRSTSPWARVAGVEYVNDLRAIWGDPQIQLVVVCTTSDSHARFAREALERGKHVLVEKPFAQTADEARELFALAERRGLFLQCYQNRRFFYGRVKVSVKSSYFRVKARPSFVAYGTRGMFVKEAKDRQEEHLKVFYLPGRPGFGVDLPEHYGTVTYYGDDGSYHEEKVTSEVGDYARIYDGVHESIVNGAPKIVRDEQTIELIGILEEGLRPILERERANAGGAEGRARA